MKSDETVICSPHLPTYNVKCLSPNEVIISQLGIEEDCDGKLFIKVFSIDNFMLVQVDAFTT